MINPLTMPAVAREDAIGSVLNWVLLTVALEVVTFALFGGARDGHPFAALSAGALRYGLGSLDILGAAFWNVVGAGMFGGGMLNASLVHFCEHGTSLALNCAHPALFGASGLLGIGFIYFCRRYAASEQQHFSETAGRWAFWLYHGATVRWILFNFLPIGWPQLAAQYEHGCAYARSHAFYATTTFWQAMRMPADIVFAAGVLFVVWGLLVTLRPPLGRSAAPVIGSVGALAQPAQKAAN